MWTKISQSTHQRSATRPTRSTLVILSCCATILGIAMCMKTPACRWCWAFFYAIKKNMVMWIFVSLWRVACNCNCSVHWFSLYLKVVKNRSPIAVTSQIVPVSTSMIMGERDTPWKSNPFRYASVFRWVFFSVKIQSWNVWDRHPKPTQWLR